MSNNKNFNRAKINKNDEFFTLYKDIHNELKHYKDQFKGKKIYCNCDNENSNFVKYLKDKKEEYGIEAIVHYDGDFRSNDSTQLLEMSDIVITNPPFSLFRVFLEQLIRFDKKFLILGTNGALTYQSVFNYFKQDKVRIGYFYGLMLFKTHTDEIKRLGNINWYTNLEITKEKTLIQEKDLFRIYNKNDYPEYDNYKAININKVKQIPKDYFGIMGVPITYLNKHNPKLFNLLGQSNTKKENTYFMKGKKPYARVFIKRR